MIKSINAEYQNSFRVVLGFWITQQIHNNSFSYPIEMT